MNTDKRFYQLCIYKLLDDYYRDTIWRSRLYSTEKGCMDGCINTEIFDIAEIVHYYEKDNKDDYENGDLDTTTDREELNVKESYDNGILNVIRHIEGLKQWLQNKERKFYREPRPMTDDQPIFWEIDGFPVATE